MLTKPTIYNLSTDYARYGISVAERDRILGYCFPNRRLGGVQGSVQNVVGHIQAGVTWGSLDWWANGYDRYGNKITASASYLAQKDGSLLVCIPENDAPWTNGDVDEPTAAADELMGRPGNKNLYTISIEREGWPSDDVIEAQDNAIAWLIADIMGRYPHLTVDDVIPHAAINSVDRAFCGLWLPRVMDIVEAELAAPAPEPVYENPVGLPFDLNSATGWQVLNGLDVLMVDFEDEAIRDAIPRSFASDKAAPSGPKVRTRDIVRFKAIFNAPAPTPSNPNRVIQWRLRADDGSRIRSSAFYTHMTARKR